MPGACWQRHAGNKPMRPTQARSTRFRARACQSRRPRRRGPRRPCLPRLHDHLPGGGSRMPGACCCWWWPCTSPAWDSPPCKEKRRAVPWSPTRCCARATGLCRASRACCFRTGLRWAIGPLRWRRPPSAVARRGWCGSPAPWPRCLLPGLCTSMRGPFWAPWGRPLRPVPTRPWPRCSSSGGWPKRRRCAPPSAWSRWVCSPPAA